MYDVYGQATYRSTKVRPLLQLPPGWDDLLALLIDEDQFEGVHMLS